MIEKFKNFFAKKKNQLGLPACLITAIASTTTMAMAAPTAEGLIGEILKVIFKIAGYIGVLLLVWGVVVLVLAIRNEDADSKSRAVLFIVVAIVLLCLGSLFGPLMTLAGFSIT